MGTEDQEGKGTHPKDIINAVKGHVSEKYKFNLVSPLSEDSPFFNKSPTLNDKAHCFVYIVSADQVSLLTGGIVDKIKTVKSEVTDLGVPQVVLLTKVDLACPVVKDDLKNVYKSKYIKELMEKCSQIIGIPANCILPVKNYHEETTLNDDVDVFLILTALLQILRFADDYFENLCC
ncbi:LOW QUALITY PROTEIN: interferon-induced protein 44-like [Lepisosteus oculatus]|uniref:LOW QUALITY PROTEIN: interferon-induced protein 44-like n=1 Tax=Lepisosteus oculatus TaxID=7918 RepID=UPI00371909C0